MMLEKDTVAKISGFLTEDPEKLVPIEATPLPSGSPRFRVMRLRPAGLSESLIFKGLPSSRSEARYNLLNEWAGLVHLSRVDSTGMLAPRFYGGDREAGFVLMADLGSADTLESLLLGEDAQAAKVGLVALATSLGQLHAAGIGALNEFRVLRKELDLPPDDLAERHWVQGLSARLAAKAKLFSLKPSTGFDSEISALTALYSPGPFFTFTHGDPCPCNGFVTQNGLRFIDFENSGYRHALLDGIYLYSPGNSCWCAGRVPEPVTHSMERAYREALARGCPEAADDNLYYRHLTAACGLLALKTWLGDEPERAMPKGLSNTRQRVLLRTKILQSLSVRHGHFPALTETLVAMADHLKTMNTIGSDALALYPAFDPNPPHKEGAAQERAAQERVALAQAPNDYAGFVGRYRINPHFTLSIEKRAGKLFVNPPWGPLGPFELLPLSPGKFFLQGIDLQTEFTPSHRGRGTVLTIIKDGKKTVAPMIEGG